MIDPIDVWLGQAEGTQKAIEDLEGLRDQLLEPVREANRDNKLTPEQQARYDRLLDQRK